MALFNRRRPDPGLPALDAVSAERLRSLVRQSLDGLGIAASVEGGHIDSELGYLSLEPVARECADQDSKAWPYLVDEVVKRMVRSLVEGAVQLSDATVADHVVQRLLPDSERMGRSFRYVRPVAGEDGALEAVSLALAWDGEETLDVLNDAALSEVHDLDAAFEAGRRNLLVDLDAAEATAGTLPGGIVEIGSASWLTASWALLAGQVAHRFLPGAAGAVVMAAPDHRRLLIGPDSEETLDAMAAAVGDSPVLASARFGL